MRQPSSSQTAAPPEVTFPLYLCSVPAGFPSPADDHLAGQIDLNRQLVKHPAATFFVKVSGDSMIGAGIHPGDTLIIDRALNAAHGQVVLAVVNGEFTVKRLDKTPEGGLRLLPENPAYEPIAITGETDFQVWGVVTYVLHALV